MHTTKIGVLGGPVPSLATNPDEWPLRHVVVYCDHCGHELDADVHAEDGQEAIAKLRAHAAAELGWRIDADDTCVQCIGRPK